MANKYIKHINISSFNGMNDRIYDKLGYNLIDSKTGIRKGDEVKTYRYSIPVFHPLETRNDVLIIMKAVTRWHKDGSFTKESPVDIPGLIRNSDLTDMKSRAEWHLEGFFPLPDDASRWEKIKDKLKVWWG